MLNHAKLFTRRSGSYILSFKAFLFLFLLLLLTSSQHLPWNFRNWIMKLKSFVISNFQFQNISMCSYWIRNMGILFCLLIHWCAKKWHLCKKNDTSCKKMSPVAKKMTPLRKSISHNIKLYDFYLNIIYFILIYL